MSELLRQARCDKAVVPGHSLNSLTRSVGQQLEQSGLLAALPRLLEAAGAALDASAHAPNPSGVAQTLCRVISSMYTDGLQSGTQREAVDEGVLGVVRAHLAAERLLELVNHCLTIWPHQVDTAAIGVPALRLCAAAFQHCSRCADALPAAAAAPTALEQLMVSAWSTAHATRVALTSQQEGALDPSVLRSPDAVRAFCMLLVMGTVALRPGDADVLREAAQRSATTLPAAAGSSDPRVQVVENCWSEASVAASQVAWQAACARESSLSTAQQQALQQLGCSGRALLWVTGHALAPFTSVGYSGGAVLTTVGSMLMYGGKPLVMQQDSSTLDQPQQMRQLAGALSQLQPRDSPPCGSPLLPCAALLWLMPAAQHCWHALALFGAGASAAAVLVAGSIPVQAGR